MLADKTTRCHYPGCWRRRHGDAYCRRCEDTTTWNRCGCGAVISRQATRCHVCVNASRAGKGARPTKWLQGITVTTDDPITVATLKSGRSTWDRKSDIERLCEVDMARLLVKHAVLSEEVSREIYPGAWAEMDRALVGNLMEAAGG